MPLPPSQTPAPVRETFQYCLLMVEAGVMRREAFQREGVRVRDDGWRWVQRAGAADEQGVEGGADRRVEGDTRRRKRAVARLDRPQSMRPIDPVGNNPRAL
jgi:hypothetical protein